ERVRRDERRDVAIDPQHCFRRALVTPRALAVAGNGRHVVQQAGKLEVDVPHGQFVDIPCGWLVVSSWWFTKSTKCFINHQPSTTNQLPTTNHQPKGANGWHRLRGMWTWNGTARSWKEPAPQRQARVRSRSR